MGDSPRCLSIVLYLQTAFGIHNDTVHKSENQDMVRNKTTKSVKARSVLGDLGNRSNPTIGDKRKEAKVNCCILSRQCLFV
jgi:hypothetical protein